MLQSRWGRRLAAVYVLMVVFAGGFLTYHVLFSERTTEFLAVPFIALGMPWYLLIARLFDPDAAIAISLVMALSLAVNAVLLYWLGAMMEHFKSRRVHEAR